MEQYNPEYVLILSGDHIYKMDYEIMLDYHKANNADVTIAAMPVPMEEAKRFGIVVTDDDNRITDFQEKPEEPKSNLASMGIYIFKWSVLKDALVKLKNQSNCDFGKHIIPYCFGNDNRIFAYEYNGYWKDVGTLGSYWEANMELIDIIPVFNLYEEFWRIYTKSDTLPPQYIADTAKIERSIISEGCDIHGEVYNSVIGAGVTIEEGAVVRDSIIMKETVISKGAKVDKAVIAEQVVVGENTEIGIGEELPSKLDKKIYAFGLATIGEKSVIPKNVKIGKNTAIMGVTEPADYPEGLLESGEYIIKAGDM
jgi:glucose-1-phosphate adenylyltransferase